MRYAYAALIRDTTTGVWLRHTAEIVTTRDPFEELRTPNRKPIWVRRVYFRMPQLLWWRRISPGTLKVWYDQMAMLTHLSPAKAVGICAQRSDGQMRKLLFSLEGELANATLEEAMSRHPEIPDHHVAQVSVLRNQTRDVQKETWTTLGEMVASESTLTRKFRKAVTNLIAILVGGIGVLALIGRTVTPGVESFASTIALKKVSEPASTAWASWFVQAVAGPPGWIIGAVILAVIAAIAVIIRVSPNAGRRYERILWKVPYFGNIVRMIETARIARAFGPIYLAQSPAVAVRRIRGVSSRWIVQDELARVSDRLAGKDTQGMTDLPRAFASPILDPLFSQYLVGAGSGAKELAVACRAVGNALERDAFSRLEQWLEEFEPWLSGLMIGSFYVLLSFLLLPLFDAFSSAAHAHAQTYYIPQ